MNFSSPGAPQAESEHSSEMSVRLIPPSGDGFRGRMDDLRDLVASIVFEAREAPRLAVGATVKLAVQVEEAKPPLEATTRILSRAEAPDGGRVYGLKLPSLGSVGGNVSAHLTSVFNRRSTYRVRPQPLTQVSVGLDLGADSPPARASLADISVGGLGLRVAPSVERRLQRIDVVHLKFRLPGSPEIEIPASIRSRQMCGRQVRYGLKFEAEGESWTAGKREVVSYVTRRQAEDLRRAREGRL